MKKLTRYMTVALVAVGLTVSFTSCGDELNIDPTAELENEFFDSEWNVQRGIGACYAGFSLLYSTGNINSGVVPQRFWMLPGDDLVNSDGNDTFERFQGLEPTNGIVGNVWSRLYQIIYRTNFMLDRLDVPEIKAVVTRTGLYEANRGEALFLRSWCFYNLWDWYRKAPIQDFRITSIDDAILPPSEGFELLDKAIESLKEAAELLPPASFWKEDETGRVFNESAYALLVKCYVLRARYNDKSQTDYAEAIKWFEKITTRSLVPFADNFDYHFNNNSESLFEYQAGQNVDNDNPFLDNNFGGGVGELGAFYHFFTNYWTSYGSGIYGPTTKLLNAFDANDPRLELTASTTMHTNVYGDINVPQPYGWDYFNGYQFQKYVRPGRCWFDATFGITSTNNPRIIRYADIKLLAAEAYLQTSDATKALKQVNDIRERARNSREDGVVSAVPANLPSVTMQDIMDERFRELAGEGMRWSDLRSWHAAGFINLGNWKSTDFGNEYDEKNFLFEIPKHLLFPIPQGEMNTNPLMIAAGNNPGYN